jgi:hypothetical protein
VAGTGKQVIEIREAPVMTGHSEVILINHDAESDLIHEGATAPVSHDTAEGDSDHAGTPLSAASPVMAGTGAGAPRQSGGYEIGRAHV